VGLACSHWQRLWSPDRSVAPPLHACRGEPQPGIAAAQRRERELELKPGEGCAEAVVRPQAEAEVPVVLTRQVDVIGPGELSWITIGGGNPEPNRVAGGDCLLTEDEIGQCPSGKRLERAVEAQEFFDDRLDRDG
jgi:hypothetical protein